MTAFAQTNLQLYGQLSRLGYTETEQERLRTAYELARSLFPDLYRASGKPFLAHLVGTASILASERASVAVLCGGLLHAGYVQGDFGNALPGASESRRSSLREAVGAEAEAIVDRYASLPWTLSLASQIAASAGALPALDRDVIFVRLANELEDLLDWGSLYSSDAERQIENLRCAIPDWIATSRAIGRDGLATRFAISLAELSGVRIPGVLRSEQTRSFRVTRASLSPRWTTVLHGLTNRVKSLGRGIAYRLRKRSSDAANR